MSRQLKQLTLVLTLLPICAPALAQSFNTQTPYRIGIESIDVPTPTNFLETSKNAPDIWEKAKTFTTTSNRVLSHYAPESELKTILAGGEVRLSQYMYVQTPMRAENITTTQAQFDKLRMNVIALQNDLDAKIRPKLKNEVARASKNLGTMQGEQFSVKVGEVVPVSIDRNDATVFICTTLMGVASTQSDASYESNVLTSSAIIFVKGKVLILSVNRVMQSPRDIQIVRSFANEWASAIIGAN